MIVGCLDDGGSEIDPLGLPGEKCQKRERPRHSAIFGEVVLRDIERVEPKPIEHARQIRHIVEQLLGRELRQRVEVEEVAELHATSPDEERFFTSCSKWRTGA